MRGSITFYTGVILKPNYHHIKRGLWDKGGNYMSFSSVINVTKYEQHFYMAEAPGFLALMFNDSGHCLTFRGLVLSVLGVWYRHSHVSPVAQ